MSCGLSLHGPRVTEDLDEPYPLRSDVDSGTPSSRFRPRIRKRLSAKAWTKAFDAQGRLVDLDGTLKHIQRGGIQPAIRNQVWEFLLGLFAADSTLDDRRLLRETRRQSYLSLLNECRAVDPIIGTGVVVEAPRIREDGSAPSGPIRMSQSLSAMGSSEEEGGGEGGDDGGADVAEARGREGGKVGEGDGRVEEEAAQPLSAEEERGRKWRWGLHQIGVDVLRTDRTLEIYEKEEQRGRLMEVLAVYAWLDTEVGYCQGMSDLISPFVAIFPTNADAFWAFERLMRRVRSIFQGDQSGIGVQEQLVTLSAILSSVDPVLYNHLERVGAGSYFFAVRTLMTLFRRELSFSDSLYMWEMMWAMDYDAHEAAEEARWERRSGEAWMHPLPTARTAGRGAGKGCGPFRKTSLRYGQAGDVRMSGEWAVVTFCVAALLEHQRERLLGQTKALDEVMKEFNEVMDQVEMKKVCKNAVALHKRHCLQAAGRAGAKGATQGRPVRVGRQ